MRKSSIMGLGALLAAMSVQVASAATPEDDAEDAAHDLSADKFYNRPGATRAEYEADWAACRLIARGVAPPSKSYPRAGAGDLPAGPLSGVLPEVIGMTIRTTVERRFSRNSCLLVRGWRQYSLAPAEKQRVKALSDAERTVYFDQAIGARATPGISYGRTDFEPPHDAMLVTDGNPTLPGSVYVGRKIDPAVAVTVGPEEGVVILAFRRPDKGSAGRAGEVQIQRYDKAGRDLAYPASDAVGRDDPTTYSRLIESIDRNAAYEAQVVRLTPGDYVIAGSAIARILLVGTHTNANCFGAPLFHVDASQTVYIGDFTPFWGVKLSNGGWGYGLGYSRHIEDARATLQVKQPMLATAMRQAEMFNQAPFTCVGGLMDRWDLPGLEPLH